MSSAAHDQSYGHTRWSNRNCGPWGSWGGGGGWGWRWAGAQGASESGGDPGWGPAWGPAHPLWVPHFVPKPVLIVLTILGFMLWWPIGLVLLMVTLCRRHMFCGYPLWRGWQSPGAEPGAGSGWKSWFGGERPSGPSSGNRAFDEYRAETLRRLEEEQKEFAEFLERLRFAKDKSEFDQFMNERRNRPSGTPPEPPPQPAN
jgi:Protein of unknown function (DUF2852)